MQKMMNENMEKMENIIAHDFPNLVGAGILLAALGVLLFSLNIPLALTIFAALLIAFLIQFFGFWRKEWSADMGRSEPFLYGTGCRFLRVCGGYGGGKDIR
ncbi:MAG: hypothetical protein ACLR23_06040 [Clostridia bacterium]